jgi:branched-subunit amino acid aminotransferase/4-amino-4-deoxychorismate lyase
MQRRPVIAGVKSAPFLRNGAKRSPRLSEPLVYLNGQLVPASQAHLAIFDAGIVLGATVTEMTRTFRHCPWRLHDHLDRLFRSLRYTRMDIGMSKDQLAKISEELLANNARLIDHEDELGLIHFVTAGEYPTYAGMAGRAVRTTPTVCVHTFPLPFELWARKMQGGAHVVTPSIRHVPPQCYDPKMKYRSLAGQLGVPFVERDIQVFTVMNADEAFLASTPYCLLPVTKINGVPIGDGKPGPVFRRLLDAWGREVGLDIERQIVEGAARRTAGQPPALVLAEERR